MAKHNLPIDVHDHFRKANVLHGYVQKHIGEAVKHALETGQELIAAKSDIPHGGWENECSRLFDGSPRTARFYMQFARDMGAISKTAESAVLMLEGTLEAAAKAARQAARPDSNPIQKDEPETDPCPNCGSNDWDVDETCRKCKHPYGEPVGDPDEDEPEEEPGDTVVDEPEWGVLKRKAVKTSEALLRAVDDLNDAKKIPKRKKRAHELLRELLAVVSDWGAQ